MTLKNTFQKNLDSIHKQLTEVSDWMYENPELGFNEFKTSEYLVKFIKSFNGEVVYPTGNLDTAFEITYGNDGPLVVLCVEYDALPEIGHACGHNIIATASIGAGLAIKDLVNDLSDSKDYVVINIGNTKTTIVVVRWGEILGTNYFNIGIGELIDDISKSYKVTNIKAIKTIDTEGNYTKEKQDFYKVWEQALKITMESTLWNSVCPHEVFVFGGWYNKFIEERTQSPNLESLQNISKIVNKDLFGTGYYNVIKKNMLEGDKNLVIIECPCIRYVKRFPVFFKTRFFI